MPFNIKFFDEVGFSTFGVYSQDPWWIDFEPTIADHPALRRHLVAAAKALLRFERDSAPLVKAYYDGLEPVDQNDMEAAAWVAATDLRSVAQRALEQLERRLKDRPR
jgi:hypothetical protein